MHWSTPTGLTKAMWAQRMGIWRQLASLSCWARHCSVNCVDAAIFTSAPNRASLICWIWLHSARLPTRSEEHTSELQSLMRISYAVFCLKKKTYTEHRLVQLHTYSRRHNHIH